MPVVLEEAKERLPYLKARKDNRRMEEATCTAPFWVFYLTVTFETTADNAATSTGSPQVQGDV